MAKKDMEILSAVQSILMIEDHALTVDEIRDLISKHMDLNLTSEIIENILEHNPALFVKTGKKWKLNIGVD